MEAMLDARHALLARGADRLDHASLVLHAVGIALHVAQRQRIEHGGDAGGGDLRVVRHQRRHARPFHAGARRKMLLEIVGMQLDQETVAAAHAGSFAAAVFSIGKPSASRLAW